MCRHEAGFGCPFTQDFQPLADVRLHGINLHKPPNAFESAALIQVLLVEDDPDCASRTLIQVSGGGDNAFHVEWNDNLQVALSRLAKPGIDVVLLDLGLQGLSGYGTHLAITSVVGKTVPVVILTADESSMTRNITIEQGAAEYLVKQRASSVEIRQALHQAIFQSRQSIH